MVMIKSTHKVIKIQHGTVNKLDSPIEILLPQLRFSFSNIKDILSIGVSHLIIQYSYDISIVAYYCAFVIHFTG